MIAELEKAVEDLKSKLKTGTTKAPD
jgi:hypothetical protein